jgi:hypothetical protein
MEIYISDVIYLFQQKLWRDDNLLTISHLCVSKPWSKSGSDTVWWLGLKNSPTVTHVCRKRRLKLIPSACGIAGPPCFRWSEIRRHGPPGWGLGAGVTIQPLKRVIVKKPQKGRPVPELDCRAI